MKIFGGLEGGASFSKLVLMQEDGKVLSWIDDGPSTNYLLVGMKECHERINSLIQRCKKQANIDGSITLESLGLCMSGCEDAKDHDELINLLFKMYPKLTQSCSIESDTIGSLFTASPNGGIVLIAGTGSNSLLYNPDGSVFKCGGWGHLIGDYSSAFWIAQRAIKLVIESDENFKPTKHNISRTKQAILEYFNISDMLGLLKPCYVTFNKTEFAGLCARLAQIAIEDNDPLCCQVFDEAGQDLANHIVALLPKISKDLMNTEGGLKIVCVGSVFKSWNILKNGFLTVINGQIPEFTMYCLTKSSAIGAAYFGAKQIKFDLPINFKENCKILYHHKQ